MGLLDESTLVAQADWMTTDGQIIKKYVGEERTKYF